MRVLDLFCGAGGVAMGLHQAWPDAEITGVDIKPQPRYPFMFTQADAMAVPLNGYDFIWASPPCQRYSWLTRINGKPDHPDLISPIRERLQATGKPYVIENVPNSPLNHHFMLCGSMFKGLAVWRHRWFEHEGFTVYIPDCKHHLIPEPIDVTGTGGPCKTRKTPGGGLHRKPKNMAEAKAAMGIDWMIRKEIVEAVPPAYSEFIARQFSASESKAATGGGQ